MRRIHLCIVFVSIISTIGAQNVVEISGKTKTVNFQMTNGSSNGHVLQSDGSGNASWVAPSFGTLHGGGIIPFSTGTTLNGATVVSALPVLMGFGNYDFEVIDGSGESTMPPQAGGFSFIIPFTGTIQNLAISADLLVASVSSINVTPLTYVFTVHRAPSVPNNGINHVSAPYLTTPFTSSLTFGGSGNPVVAGTFYSATNVNPGSLAVTEGDRIGVRIRTNPSSDSSAADITQLSFNASLFYTY